MCRLFRQILNEVLCLTTLGIYTARYSDDDIMVGGYLISAGTPIVIALGVSLKNETVWKKTEKLDPKLQCDQGCKICHVIANCTVVNISMNSS